MFEETPDNVQLELTDLQSTGELREKLSFVKCTNFLGLLCEFKYNNLKDFGRKMFFIFASTYIYEEIFF
jgi:hypothetical protein